MDEKEAIARLRDHFSVHDDGRPTPKLNEAVSIVIKATEKQIAKKPVCKEMPYSEEVGFNEEWHCPTCGAYVGYFTEGMSEPEQMEYCNECGQHISRDWSDV